MRIAMLLAIGLTLGGCGGSPVPPSSLLPPAKRCMAPPAKLAAVRPGDDLVQQYASTIRSYKGETSKLRCVQKWARTVLAK